MKVLPKRVHSTDNTTECFYSLKLNGRNQNLILMTSNLFCILHSKKGDLLFFNIREQCMEEWENKLKEMEMEGIWETVTKEKLSVDDDDKTNAFVFKLP